MSAEQKTRRGLIDEIFSPARRNFPTVPQIVKGPLDQVLT
jgi:hypothetical protein